MRRIVVVCAAAFGLSACGNDSDPRLLNLQSAGRGPDEFAILPTRPLQEPPSYDALPPPTPGAGNLADPAPRADAVAALGGNAAALSRRGLEDPALVGHATRYGVAPTIRQDLAVADLEFRRRNDGRLLERVFNVNIYFDAYRAQELDQYRELDRFRRAGVRTPSVPPEPTD